LVQSSFYFFFPRFLLYLGPPCLLLLARGIVTLARNVVPIAGVLLIAGLMGLWMPGLAQVYAKPMNQAEDPRPVIARVRTAARPGDAFVHVYVWQAGYLFSYYRGNELVPYRAFCTPRSVGDEMETIFDSHPRSWSLSYNIGARDPRTSRTRGSRSMHLE
jgi:hypothetical protein